MSKRIELYTAPWYIMLEIIGFGPIEIGDDPEQPLMILENPWRENNLFEASTPFLACYGKGSEKIPDIDFSKRSFISYSDKEMNDVIKLFLSLCLNDYYGFSEKTELVFHLGTDDWDSERFLTWKHLSNEDLLKLNISYDDFIRIRDSKQIRKRKWLEKNNIFITRESIIPPFNIKDVTRDYGGRLATPKKFPTLDQQEGNPDAW